MASCLRLTIEATMLRMVALPALLLLLSALPPAGADNMNGWPGQYKIANGNPLSDATYSTDYDAEYFEVYSDVIRTRYSEVYWTMQKPVRLPDDVVRRFDGKVMAVVGYEVDQVLSDGETSIPITWAYNHHYCAWLLNGKRAELVKERADETTGRLGLNHGGDEHWVPQLLTREEGGSDDSMPDTPAWHFFSEGNGGEFRMSYHGYPKGYAQLIESPDIFKISPMQIDTWNREAMTDAKFAPGPLPKSSQIPSDAGYSGLLECPCSDRLEKKWGMTYALQNSGSCVAPIQNATECFSAARVIVQSEHFTDNKASDGSKPEGCSIEQHSDGSTDVWWNSGGESGAEADVVPARDSAPGVSAFAREQVNLTVSLTNDDADDAARVVITGPADRWFGVGFGASSMCLHGMKSDTCPDGGPYAIIVSGDGEGAVTERKLEFHGPGSVLASSVTVLSNTVTGGNRTVVLTRALKGASNQYYTFVPSPAAVPIITARGCSLHFAQHCGHGPSTLAFLATDTPTPICEAGIEGSIGGNQFNNKICAPFPRGDLLVQNNPTCSVQTYRGGLKCCRHGQSLLDKNQTIPWADQYLEYKLKFRFYFEEYATEVAGTAAPSHQNLVRFFVATEAYPGEYDINQCPTGTPASQCVQVITARWKVQEMMEDCPINGRGTCTGEGSSDPDKTDGIKLIYAGPHCHAPTCLSMELYNADSGQLLCRSDAIHGGSDEVFDEHGFVQIPPCLWGDPSEGLAEPQLLSLDTTLLSVKRNNNTLPHTGEMALWQMRGVVVPKQEKILQKEVAEHIHPTAVTDMKRMATPTKSRGQLRKTGN